MFTPEFTSQISSWSAVAARLRDWRREPDLSGANAFDFAQWGDIGLSPNPGASLFGYGERALGRPAEIFANLKLDRNPKSKPTEALRQWRNMVERLGSYSVRGQVAGVHSYINQMDKVASEVAALARTKPWTGVLNRPSWPGLETDKALAKYVSFRLLGFHADRLRLVLADTRYPNRHLAVLAVLFGGEAFVLNDGSSGITTDNRLKEFFPSCSLNARQFYLHWDRDTDDTPARAAKRLLNQFGLAAA